MEERMAKFRKKPIVVEAEQWFPGVKIDGVIIENGKPRIATLEGTMFVSPGDWVITGVNGEKYSCKDEIFKKTHDPIDEPVEE